MWAASPRRFRLTQTEGGLTRFQMNIHSKNPFQDCVGQETTSKGWVQFNFPFLNDLEELIACTLESIDASLFTDIPAESSFFFSCAMPIEPYMLKEEWTRWSIYFSFAHTILYSNKKNTVSAGNLIFVTISAAHIKQTYSGLLSGSRDSGLVIWL